MLLLLQRRLKKSTFLGKVWSYCSFHCSSYCSVLKPNSTQHSTFNKRPEKAKKFHVASLMHTLYSSSAATADIDYGFENITHRGREK